MKIEVAIALERRFTGTDSMMSVLTGPVERNNKNMAAARQLIARVVLLATNATTETGAAASTDKPRTQAKPARLRFCHSVAAKPPIRVPSKPATTRTAPKNVAAD